MKKKQILFKKGIKKVSSADGMTMAEVLITVAIIIILTAVAFISLHLYQLSMAQTLRDGYAKQVFIAAQNHFAMARGQGYLDLTSGMTTEDEENIMGESAGGGVHYFVVEPGGGQFHYNKAQSFLDLMLPFGAIDDNVRNNGYYLIRYQAKTGKILDVFYCTDGVDRYDAVITEDDYSDLITNYKDVETESGIVSKKGARRNFNGGIVGWFGGSKAAELPTEILKAPLLTVQNGTVLTATVKKANGEPIASSLKLIITGKTSKAKRAVALQQADGDRISVTDGVYTFVLDDVASNKKFKDISAKTNYSSNGKNFIPGEDLKLEAVTFCTDAFSNIIYSPAVTENSLFDSIADPEDIKTNKSYPSFAKVATISNIRHLENLDKSISSHGSPATTEKGINIIIAKQVENIDADSYDYIPVNLDNSNTFNYDNGKTQNVKFIYDGLRHSISNVTVSKTGSTGNAGIFDKISTDVIVRNLEIIDPSVSVSASAGALAGELNGGKVDNVIARNTNTGVYDDLDHVSVSGDITGGLIGTMGSGSTLSHSAAALIVSGSTAGGLVGSASGGTISESYSGGRTTEGKYSDSLFNVAGTSVAGGLVGSAGGATIQNSYSTCSVQGNTAGGLAGSINGATVKYCYSTGYVDGDADTSFAFIGSGAYANGSQGNHYYQISNEMISGNIVDYLLPVAGYNPANADHTAFVSAIDSNKNTFNTFTGGSWNKAKPYDETLDNNFSGYSFATVTQLEKNGSGNSSSAIANSSSGKGGYFVNTHYGDWPFFEGILIN